MRILLLSNKLPYPPRDGGAIATLNLIKGLSYHGNKILVFSINTSKHYFNPDLIPDDIRSLARFNTVYQDTSISIFKLLYNLLFSNKPYNATRFVSKEIASALKETILAAEYDLVHIEGLYMCPYISVIREHSKVPIVFRPHNIEHEIWERTTSNTGNYLKKHYLKILTKRLKKFETSFINQYDAIVPITSRDGNKFNNLGNQLPLMVAPAGIYPEIYKQKSSSTQQISLFHIGGLDWGPNQEGLEWFINKCWPAIHASFPDLKFYIAGRNANLRFINSIIAPGVIFDGEVEDACQYMASKSILIIPLLSGSGMRIKLLEAMAIGKAIVSTSIGAEGIDVINGENILIADDANEFINAITGLIGDAKLMESIGENAKKFVCSKYNNDDICASLSNFYKTLTGISG